LQGTVQQFTIRIGHTTLMKNKIEKLPKSQMTTRTLMKTMSVTRPVKYYTFTFWYMHGT
jgi:hypothetical protein